MADLRQWLESIRDSELRLLHDLYAKAKSGKGQFVLISGEPGIGKSRLIVALCERLHTDRHNVLTFQCSSHHTSSAWSALLRYLEDILGIGRDTVPAVKLERLEHLADQYLKETRLSSIPLLAALLSIPTDGKYQRPRLSAQKQKERTFVTLLNLFHAHARRRPAIVIFEDVHCMGMVRPSKAVRCRRRPLLATKRRRPGIVSPPA
jgi:predicted ATPase